MTSPSDWLADAPDDTFGVEEEFYLVDAMSGELADRADEVVSVSDGPDLETEVLTCTVESSTPACRTAEECSQILIRQREVLASRAAVLGLELGAAGVPPMLRREEIAARVDPSHPQARFLDELAAVGELDILACHGIHVHVGLRDFASALLVTDALMSQLPLLIARTANSRANAFGANCASLRTALLLRSPFVGVTPRFTDVEDLQRATAAAAPDRSGHPRPRWIIAPAPHYGTVELRGFDSNTDVRVALELALVSRAIADAALDGVTLSRPSEWIERTNLHNAVTFGSEAALLDAHHDGHTVQRRWSALMSVIEPYLTGELPALTG